MSERKPAIALLVRRVNSLKHRMTTFLFNIKINRGYPY